MRRSRREEGGGEDWLSVSRRTNAIEEKRFSSITHKGSRPTGWFIDYGGGARDPSSQWRRRDERCTRAVFPSTVVVFNFIREGSRLSRLVPPPTVFGSVPIFIWTSVERKKENWRDKSISCDSVMENIRDGMILESTSDIVNFEIVNWLILEGELIRR